jgi:hypothetical protein
LGDAETKVLLTPISLVAVTLEGYPHTPCKHLIRGDYIYIFSHSFFFPRCQRGVG